MAGIFAENKVILFKKEATYGVDAAPTAAMLTRDFALRPAEARSIERNLDKPGFGATPALVTGMHVATSFKVDAAGSGTAGTALAFNELLMACGHSQTLTASVKAEYKPVSSGFDSGTLYAHKGGILAKALGWRGSLGLELSPNSVPSFMFEGQGLYVAQSDVANPVADFTAFRTPVPVEKANTLIATFNGVAVELVNLNCSFGQEVIYRNLPNLENVSITGRQSTATLEFLKKTIAGINPPALMKAQTLVPLIVEHGITAGNIIRLDALQCQITGVSEGVADKEETWQLTLKLTPTGAGNDDYLITAK